MAAQFAGQYQQQFIVGSGASQGNPLALTSYTVYESDGTTPSTLYSDRVKSATVVNPQTTDQYGNASFFVEPGPHKITCNGLQIAVTVAEDPAEDVDQNLATTAGDKLIATGANTLARFAAPAIAGQTDVYDPAATAKFTNGYPTAIGDGAMLPTGAFASTIRLEDAVTNMAALTSQTLYLVGIPLSKGAIVTTATFFSGTTPLAAGVNQWFALYSSARGLLKVTNDDGATAWAANSAKTLTFTSTYTVVASGLYYLGILIRATVPTLLGSTLAHANLSNVAPIRAGNSTAGLTNPASAPDPAAAITAATFVPWAYVS